MPDHTLVEDLLGGEGCRREPQLELQLEPLTRSRRAESSRVTQEPWGWIRALSLQVRRWGEGARQTNDPLAHPPWPCPAPVALWS